MRSWPELKPWGGCLTAWAALEPLNDTHTLCTTEFVGPPPTRVPSSISIRLLLELTCVSFRTLWLEDKIWKTMHEAFTTQHSSDGNSQVCNILVLLVLSLREKGEDDSQVHISGASQHLKTLWVGTAIWSHSTHTDFLHPDQKRFPWWQSLNILINWAFRVVECSRKTWNCKSYKSVFFPVFLCMSNVALDKSPPLDKPCSVFVKWGE